jgi:A/G-specific adenine glycosylase
MNLQTPLPALRLKVLSLFAPIVPRDRPGDFVQAIMDLGATTCRPRNLKCNQCPWFQFCEAQKYGKAENLPVRAPKKKKPTRLGVVFWLEKTGGKILLRRRPEKGILGGMMEFPSTDWRDKIWDVDEAIKMAPFNVKWQPLLGTVHHTFTHFNLELTVFIGYLGPRKEGQDVWSRPEFFADYAMPTLMKKIAKPVSLSSDVACF